MKNNDTMMVREIFAHCRHKIWFDVSGLRSLEKPWELMNDHEMANIWLNNIDKVKDYVNNHVFLLLIISSIFQDRCDIIKLLLGWYNFESFYIDIVLDTAMALRKDSIINFFMAYSEITENITDETREKIEVYLKK